MFWDNLVHGYHLQKEQAESHQKSKNPKNDETEMQDTDCSMHKATFFHLSTTYYAAYSSQL